MTSIKLDSNCDIVFDDNGVCEIVEDYEDIAQAIRVELEQNKGQWSLNTLYGVPYLNNDNTGILQTKNSKEKIINEIRKVISKYDVDSATVDIIDGKVVAKIKINGKEVDLIDNR